MKKTKRILSMLTALAITASAFASLAVPASAADTAIAVGNDGTLTITSDKAQSAELIQATYSEGKLSSVTAKSVTLQDGVNTPDITVQEGATLMLWSSIGGEEGALKPLCASVTAPSAFTLPEGVYINEPFNYDDGQIIKSAGNDVEKAYDPVTKGSIVYAAGRRNNGLINCNASIASKELVVSSDGYGDGRGVWFTFADEANIPKIADIEDTEVLEMQMKVKATQAFTVTDYGVISTADLTTTTAYVKLRIILDKKAGKKYQIVTDLNNNLLSSKASDLGEMKTFKGIQFNQLTGSFTIDDLIVTKHDTNTGIINVTVNDTSDGTPKGLASATVSVNSRAFTTGSDGTVAIAVPNGTYEIEASKNGYEHTEGMEDNDTASVTINSDTKPAEFSLSLRRYDKEPTTINFTGGQTFIAAPKTSTPSTTAAFGVNVLDQFGIPMTAEEYTLTWDILPKKAKESDPDPESDPNVTIDENGVVSVAQAFSAANDISIYEIKATVVANNAGLRGMSETTDITVGNMDVIYYEPIAWSLAGGSGNRDETKTLASAVTLPDMSSISTNISFSEVETQTTFAIVADGGKLVGLQYAGGKVKAWTGWTGSSAMNQTGDVDKFTKSAVLVESYTVDTPLDVTFVIDKKAKSITVSCGSVTESLSYSINATKIQSLQYGQYRNKNQMKVNGFLVKEPDPNYLSVNGVTKVAKIADKDVERTYTLGQSVLVDQEQFTWSVASASGGSTTGVSIADGVLKIEDTAAAGNYTITATSTTNAQKTASATVEVKNYQTLTNSDVDISGPRAYEYGTDTTGTYAITKMVDSVGDDVTALLAKPTWTSSNTSVATIDPATGVLTVVGEGETTITATIVNGTATSTLTVPVTVGTFSLTDTTNVAAGSTIDISSLVSNDKVTGYQVTVADASKNQLVSQKVSASGTNVTVPAYTGTGASVEVTPVFEADLGDPGSLGVVGNGKDMAVPTGRYNFTVTDTGSRVDIYANDQMLVNNILQGGSAVNSLDVNDIEITGGNARIYTADRAGTPNLKIKVYKSPSNVNRKKKVYVLGDSLVCIYYNGGDATHNYQTGFGQVLQQYLTDDVEVVDLGNSGAYAEVIAVTAMTQVTQSAKEGDIVLIEGGYNDRSYSTKEKTIQATKNMITAAEATGATVVLTTPPASQHDYKAGVSWSDAIKDAATDTETNLIDLATLSYNFLHDIYGDDSAAVKASYNVSDGLHSNYNGAMKMAEIVAQGLYDITTPSYKSIINTSFTYSFTDTKGNTIDCQVKAN